MRDQLVSEVATFTTYRKQKRRISMPSTGFKPKIPAIKQLQTYALDGTATWISADSHSIFVSYRSRAPGIR